MLELGQPAPDFTLTDQDGNEITLSSLRGQPVVVYFYPRADTAGCTTEACGFRDHWAEFEAAGAAVLGISPDEVSDQAKFAKKHDLPHRLLSDTTTEVLRAYGAWGKRQKFGREFDGVLRSTVLVAPDGTVAALWPKVTPQDHADEVLEALGDLAA